MINEANTYCQKGRSRSAIYAANRFARLVDDRPIDQVDSDAIDEYVAKCRAAELSPATVRSSVKYLIAIARDHGVDLKVPRISVPRPEPIPTSVDDICVTWAHLRPWVQQWTALTYWTALRVSDALAMQLAIHDGQEFGDHITWRASKTGRTQRWPVPDWLRPFLLSPSLPWGRANDHAQRLLRAELSRASIAAGIETILPKYVRQRSITAWKTADATAGSIIHGSGLGVLDHYVDPLTILAAAAPRVKLPDCFGAATDQPDVLPLFRRLDPAGQQLILSTMERLA